MDEKQEILENYNNLTDNLNKMIYLSMYLKWLIDNCFDKNSDLENSDEYLYLYRKIEELSIIYSLQDDVIKRFRRQIDNMISIIEPKNTLNLTNYLNENNQRIIEIHKNKNI